MDHKIEEIQNIRTDLVKLRDRMNDLKSDENHQSLLKDHANNVEGLLTCGIVYLYNTIQELTKLQIQKDDHTHGPSIKFIPRGIGTDKCSCFVCGNEYSISSCISNIAAFVESKEDGEKVVKWFKGGARLDFRPTEPNWIQVKIGACGHHIENLKYLYKKTSKYQVIREVDFIEALNL